jgi:GrpB-like predicted nucleotidyltransferase (UPF0157 family)
MIGLKPGTVSISQHDQRWNDVFERERDRIKRALGGVVLAAEHVGSTSVPDLAAKPIVDIAIAIASFEDFAPHVTIVETLGYIYRGENGVPRRHYFVLGDPRTVHLHFIEHDSDAWHAHLAFREKMCSSPELRRQYMDLKHDLAARFPNDRDAYTAGKQAFIHSIIDPILAERRRAPTPD